MMGPLLAVAPQPIQGFFDLVNLLCEPWLFFTLTMVVFFAAIYFRRTLVKPPVALGILIASVAAILVSFMSPQFKAEASKPDNAPIFMLVYITGFCIWLAFWQAVKNDERLARGEKPEEYEVGKTRLHVWPYLLYIEGIVAAFVLAALFIWALSLEAPLEQAANPAKSPNPAKAPWYFLGLQEMLVYYDPWIAGVVLPGMIISGLIVIPYCDPNPKGLGYYTFAERKLAVTTFLFGFLIMWVVLIFVGTFMRGPNWNFFGLYEPWDVHKVLSLNNVNLSQMFWQDGMGKALPAAWWQREWPGFLLILAYFAVLPGVIMKLAPKLYRDLGFIRYSVLVVHFLVMLSLPIKMYLRWSLNLKYIVSIPEYFFNI
ncbi:MAG: cytochrome C [Planctomycetota bacterium]|nr:cytochrome C [Planctomycetota bacterium]